MLLQTIQFATLSNNKEQGRQSDEGTQTLYDLIRVLKCYIATDFEEMKLLLW